MHPHAEMEPAKPVQIYLPVAALLVAFCGFFAAATLSVGHVLKLAVPCGASGGCAAVASHPSSIFLGIPVAFFGVAAYVGAISLLLRVSGAKWAGYALVAITSLGTLVSAGLLIYAQTVIGATCTWCLVSGAAMAILFVLSIVLSRSRHALRAIPIPLVWRLAVVAAIGLGAETWFMQRSSAAPPIPAERLAALPVSDLLDGGNSLGPAHAKVKIVIFSDLWCSVCRGVHRPLLDYQSAHPDDVQVIFRHRPLSHVRGHETSETAATLSEVAADQGKFWQFVAELYRQPNQLDHDGYLGVMRGLGFPAPEIEAILKDPHAIPTARVQRDIVLADRLGVQSTPTFVLILGHNPPISANHRMLEKILNSPAVQALFAQR